MTNASFSGIKPGITRFLPDVVIRVAVYILESLYIYELCIKEDFRTPSGVCAFGGRIYTQERKKERKNAGNKFSFHLVGSKSHCRAAPAVPSPICCTSNLIFINYVSLKPYVSHIYFTVVNKTKIVFCGGV